MSLGLDLLQPTLVPKIQREPRTLYPRKKDTRLPSFQCVCVVYTFRAFLTEIKVNELAVFFWCACAAFSRKNPYETKKKGTRKFRLCPERKRDRVPLDFATQRSRNSGKFLQHVLRNKTMTKQKLNGKIRFLSTSFLKHIQKHTTADVVCAKSKYQQNLEGFCFILQTRFFSSTLWMSERNGDGLRFPSSLPLRKYGRENPDHPVISFSGELQATRGIIYLESCNVFEVVARNQFVNQLLILLIELFLWLPPKSFVLLRNLREENR